MSKDESVNINTENVSAKLQEAISKAAADVASAAASSGTSTGNVQADAGIAGRYAGSGVDFGNDTGQAEAWTNLNLRRAENQETYDQAVRALQVQAAANAQVIANRQNQGGQATTERINAVQENSLMFDNDWLIAFGLQNPTIREAIVASYLKTLEKKEG